MASYELSVVPMTNFQNTQAFKKLTELAKTPFDLTSPGALTPERIRKFSAESTCYTLLFGTERITEKVMEGLVELASETRALEKMNKMQSGEILNYIEGFPSEERQVLHTATRDFFNPYPSEKAKEAATLAKREADKLQKFMEQVDTEGKFTDLIAIGIGGSNLGPYANYLAMEHLQKADRQVHFISNIDPDETAKVLDQVDLSSTLVLLVSKSGTTLETVTNEALVRNAFEQAGLNPREHFITATSEGSPMDDRKKYLETFHLWDWVGGRFCSTSMVGGVILSFAFGFDVYWEFLKGASDMDKAALEKDPMKNLPLLIALLGIWNRNFLQYPTYAVVPYSSALARYPAHIQQADMESNGKHIDRKGGELTFHTGPIAWGEPGTNAQHSFFQLIHQGTDIIPVEFIGYKNSQRQMDLPYRGTTSQQKLLANMFAQAIALAEGRVGDNPNKEFQGNRPSHILLSEDLTPYSVGALLAMIEHKVAFQGFIWNINSFDQEGVQLGKELANHLLELFALRNGTLGAAVKPDPIGETLLDILDEI